MRGGAHTPAGGGEAAFPERRPGGSTGDRPASFLLSEERSRFLGARGASHLRCSRQRPGRWTGFLWRESGRLPIGPPAAQSPPPARCQPWPEGLRAAGGEQGHRRPPDSGVGDGLAMAVHGASRADWRGRRRSPTWALSTRRGLKTRRQGKNHGTAHTEAGGGTAAPLLTPPIQCTRRGRRTLQAAVPGPEARAASPSVARPVGLRHHHRHLRPGVTASTRENTGTSEEHTALTNGC